MLANKQYNPYTNKKVKMKTLALILIIALFSCDGTDKKEPKLKYQFEVSGNESMSATIKKDGEWLKYYSSDWEPIVESGSFVDTLQIYAYPQPLHKAVRLKIWVYGKLEYDKWSDGHTMEIVRTRGKTTEGGEHGFQYNILSARR